MDFDIITNGLKKAFNAWKDNFIAYLIGAILVVIVAAIIGGLGFLIGGGASILDAMVNAINAGSIEGLENFGRIMIGLFSAALLFLLITVPLGFGLIYMAIKGTRGEKVEITDIFYTFKSIKVYIRTLIFLVVFLILSAIFTIIPVIGNIIFAILFIYTVFIYIMTPSEGMMYALKESFNVAKDNLVITIIALLVVLILAIIGSLLFGIGQLVTTPISLIFLAYILKELKPGIKDNS